MEVNKFDRIHEKSKEFYNFAKEIKNKTDMSEETQEKRGGCNRRVVLFFIFAILIVAAFLIVGLVKTCQADHEADQIEQMEQTLTQE